MPSAVATKTGIARVSPAIACVLCAWALTPAADAAANVGSLQARVAAARSQASTLVAGLQAKQSQLGVAQQQALAAAAREQRLSGLIASGQARAAELGREVGRSRRRLSVEKARLARARRALARRLVAIYESGDPSTASLVLGSTSFNDLATRTDYLNEIESSDAALAKRVEQVRNEVSGELTLVAALKTRVDAYNTRLAAARSQISAVRQRAVAEAAQLQSIAAARAASLSTLKANIGHWVSDIQAAQAAARQPSPLGAQAEVGRWLGGPYSIPSNIVMCESGGNYGAVNPSSGAGGAYQILPSTWHLYGGQGNPQNAPRSEQDSIAAQIWRDSGPSAWVCGG